MIEKMKPTHYLADIQKAAKYGKLQMTTTAIKNAAELGLNTKEMRAVIQNMETEHFYKSMTSNYDNKVWQDVYNVPHDDGVYYVKVTEQSDQFMLLSFKEK